MPVTLASIRERARVLLDGICHVCPVCDGRRCPTGVPGMGGIGTGASFRNNVTALAAWQVNMRVLHDRKDQNLGLRLFGQKLAFPILGAAVAGARVNFQGRIGEEELARAFVLGAAGAGSLSFTGDGPLPELMDAGLKAIRAAGGRGIPVIKPREDAEIVSLIRRAEDAGAVAIAIDVDAAGLVNMTRAGQLVEPKTVEQIAGIAAATSLPLILKGVMTVADAEAAVAGGAAAIVVSNHGGRALDHTPGTAAVLPQIAAAVGDKITVLADGGARSGVDVLKMLALGARAVLVGRPLAIAAIGGGAAGVRLQLETMADDLAVAMRLTACGDLGDIGPGILHPIRIS
ncbi:MAG: 4-hydroxymandelate oxidase [Moorella sp. (in: firmicutes)]|uniref:alpha-hydroxy-acid oxidizing protein n=1 Tax=unclassified Neomoorella TaxID=2676739 RepID=UPI0010FFBF0E|nr:MULTISPECIES: alpha-hydroxy-acid oxidizing protein [unclassified Moorella (in: firmicutes)]MDK2817120.1 4-hydroxymandelate oxidase [Moorella sp. (in: firmicutes)]MDK2895623.1 4-hydroxymandelate oxidase [Moorella sp. (in: firmicutes)]GEA14247.1 alpha-hydroxy-acid oxidizing enzyme [Moorella sp. E308F]GEA18368.1 alpha-hydroxy-acid oxidizing enzyme [Moorella sp. E306M]